jgi:iron(III) transport system substrate-binding protein
VFQRIGQEYASNVHAVDVANSSDASHLLTWKRQGMLLPYVPEDVAKHYKPEHRDADGTYAGFRATLSPMAYNTKLVKAEEAPTSFKDLLDPKWKGKIVKAHPGYSGTILTATFEMVRDIGWDFYENLAKQNIMQVQSATDPPKKLALGERSVMADGTEYNIFLLREAGQPVEAIYPTEGTPFVVGPNGIFKAAPNPNAAKLFQNYCFTPEAQQVVIDAGGLRSLHAQVKEHPGRKPLADIKLMKEDAEGAEQQSEEIKARYQKIFRV